MTKRGKWEKSAQDGGRGWGGRWVGGKMKPVVQRAEHEWKRMRGKSKSLSKERWKERGMKSLSMTVCR